MADRVEKPDDRVTIDGDFFRRQALEAMRIYFAPLVAIWKAMVESTRPMSMESSSEHNARPD